MKNSENPENIGLLPPPKRPLLSKSEYASHRGVSPSAITRAIREGRVALERVNGRELVDKKASDALWDGLTRPRVDSPGPGPDASAVDTDASGDDLLNDPEGGYKAYKTREAKAVAELRELEVQRQRGLVIPRADVRKDVTDAASIILSAMEAIPDRMAPTLLDISDQAQIHSLLVAEIQSTLNRIADALHQVLGPGSEAEAAPSEEPAT